MNALYKAFTGNAEDIVKYLDHYGTSEMREHFAEIINAGRPTIDHDLKAFTMAAMQGLLSSVKVSLGDELAQQIAEEALRAARATLSELQKQQ